MSDEYKPSTKAEEEFVKSDNNASLEEAGDASKGDVSLGSAETDAIDESNIIDSRTRGAGPEGGYAEPSEDDIEAK